MNTKEIMRLSGELNKLQEERDRLIRCYEDGIQGINMSITVGEIEIDLPSCSGENIANKLIGEFNKAIEIVRDLINRELFRAEEKVQSN